MIDGRIWRSEPHSKLGARLVSCEHITGDDWYAVERTVGIYVSMNTGTLQK